MKRISYLAVLLFCIVVGTLAASDAMSAPVKSATAEIVPVPDTPETAPKQTFGRRKVEPPKQEEGLHKLGEVPKKFAIGAGNFVLAVVWVVVKVLAVLVLVGTAVYYISRRRKGEERGVGTLAKAFDDAVKAVRTKRRELQKQVNILAKRDAVTPAKKAKPRKKPAAKVKK